MSLTSRIRALFAPEETAKVPAGMMTDTVYSESLIYSGADWPKYNPDLLLRSKGNLIYRQMMMDEQVKAVVRFKRDAITARQWYFDTDVEGKKEDSAEVPAIPKEPEEPEKLEARRAQFKAPPFQAPTEGVEDTDEAEGDEEAQPGEESAPGEMPEENQDKLELKRRGNILKAAIEQMDGSFSDALNGIMTSAINGCSFTEKVLKDIEVDGKTWVGIKHLRLKPYHSFKFYVDEYGNIEKVVQCWESKPEVDISYDKFIHHVHNSDVDPHYGSSELRDAYRAWFAKDVTIRFMNIYLERMGAGFVWLTPKDGAQNPDQATMNNLKDILRNLSAKSGIVVPAGLELNVEYPSSTDSYERAIALHDKAIAKALLVPNLLGITEQGDTGSYSQSQTQLEAFLWTLDAEASRLEDTINEQLIKPLVDINFGGAPYPRFRFEPISDTVKHNSIRIWNDLVKAGSVKPTQADSDHLRMLLDFPEAGEPLSPPPAAMIPGQPGAPPPFGNPSQPGAPPVAQKGALPSNPKAGKQGPPQGAPHGGTKGKPATKAGDETVLGKGQMRTAREEAFTRAQRRVSFVVIDNRAQQITAAGSTKLDRTLKEAVTALLQQVKDEKMNENPEAIREMRVPTRIMTKVRSAVDDSLKQAWNLGIEHARREIERAREKRFSAESAIADAAAEKYLESRAYQISGDMTDAARKVINNTIYNGIKGEWSLEDIEQRIYDLLGSDVYPYVGTAVRTSVFDAINQARWETFTDPQLGGFVEAFEFAAVLDGRTTEVCEHMNGKVYPVDSPVWNSYDPPLHYNCRSILVAVTVRDEWAESNKPDSDIPPMEGFGGN